MTVYAVTSLTAAQAHPARLGHWIRGHWGIEALHHLAITPSPRTPPRSAPAPPPRALASLRNLAIAILRRNARNATRVLPLLGITRPVNQTLRHFDEALSATPPAP